MSHPVVLAKAAAREPATGLAVEVCGVGAHTADSEGGLADRTS